MRVVIEIEDVGKVVALNMQSVVARNLSELMGQHIEILGHEYEVRRITDSGFQITLYVR